MGYMNQHLMPVDDEDSEETSTVSGRRIHPTYTHRMP